MTDTLTPTIRLTEPTPGGDSGTWATLLNSDMAYIDEAINQSITVSIADVNVVLIADGTVSDQARYLRYNFTGALTADRTVTLPANVKVGWASNNTTGGHKVILSAGGTIVSLLADGVWTFFYCDGTNVATQTVRYGSVDVNPAGGAPSGVFTGDGSTYISVGTTSAHPFLFVTNNIELARFDASGNLLFATTNTSPVTANVTGIIAKNSPGASAMVQISNPAGPGLAIGTNTSGGTLLPWFYGGVQVASISMVGNGLSVAYNTGSDYRIKVTYGPADTGAVIDAVPVHDAAFLADPSVRRPMFLAHELQIAVPWAVHGDKDAVDGNGAIVVQQVDHPSLVPTLWAELQSLRRRVAELERRSCQVGGGR